MALECLATSTANCFAAADLTLMRSLRTVKMLLRYQWTKRGKLRRNTISPLIFTYRQGVHDCQQVSHV